jgi:hypothetical protein
VVPEVRCVPSQKYQHLLGSGGGGGGGGGGPSEDEPTVDESGQALLRQAKRGKHGGDDDDDDDEDDAKAAARGDDIESVRKDRGPNTPSNLCSHTHAAQLSHYRCLLHQTGT